MARRISGSKQCGDYTRFGAIKLQADLIRLSRNSKQMIAQNSDHHIQLDAPELVTDAVRQVVNAIRLRTKLAPQ